MEMPYQARILLNEALTDPFSTSVYSSRNVVKFCNETFPGPSHTPLSAPQAVCPSRSALSLSGAHSTCHAYTRISFSDSG